ncbi:MAG TPA: hypothetical protein VKX46_11630 [Ktedonobacteraceae bacterium]|nr:hypothetical protein [Ktedonobacteraceae bacterium]
MSSGILSWYIVALIVIFIVVMIIIAISAARSRKGHPEVDGRTSSAPIPDPEHRNPYTRVDSGEQASEIVNDDFNRVSRTSNPPADRS